MISGGGFFSKVQVHPLRGNFVAQEKRAAPRSCPSEGPAPLRGSFLPVPSRAAVIFFARPPSPKNFLPEKATSGSGTEYDASKQNDDEDLAVVQAQPLKNAEMVEYMDGKGVEAPADMGRNDPK